VVTNATQAMNASFSKQQQRMVLARYSGDTGVDGEIQYCREKTTEFTPYIIQQIQS
jgi:hypothetical protein